MKHSNFILAEMILVLTWARVGESRRRPESEGF